MEGYSDDKRPIGFRDTKTWYLDCDPLALVDHGIINYVHKLAGQSILDLGCGIGGYSKTLVDLGHTVKGMDINERYVQVAREKLGVDATTYDGNSIPLPDASVDTVILVEVLEHVPEVHSFVREVARVARKNVIATVPNCTKTFRAQVVADHMLDADHKNFFTVETFRGLFSSSFGTVEITQVAPMDGMILRDLLPKWASVLWDVGSRLRLVQPKYYYRLIAHASKLD